MSILPEDFYLRDDVLQISKDLLGKYLVTEFVEGRTCGIITETEAYRAPEDRASHAFGNRKTKRNAMMFESGGIAYVYLCYGIHHLFNVVTNFKNIPHAILVRTIFPIEGIDLMIKRRGKAKADHKLTNGPGSLAQAMGITTKISGHPLNRPPVWIEDRGLMIKSEEIKASARIGVDYAGEDAKLPWRFHCKLQ